MNGEERGVPPVTWGALALIALACGVLFAGAAVATGTISAVIWIDVGVCLVLTVIFLLAHLLFRAHRVVKITSSGSRSPNWHNVIAVLALVGAVVTPPATAISRLAGLGDSGPAVLIERECRAPKTTGGHDRSKGASLS